MRWVSTLPKPVAGETGRPAAEPSGILDVIRVFDQRHRAVLAKLARAIEPHIDGVLTGFYSTLSRNPELARILANGPGLHALKNAQRAHWKILLTGDMSEELLERGRRIGAAHVRAGLSPQAYIASCAHLFVAFLKVALPDQPSAVETATALARVTFADMELALSAFLNVAEHDTRRREAQAFADSIEQEMKHATEVATTEAAGLMDLVTEMNRAIGEVRHGVAMVESGSTATSSGIGTVVAAITEIQAVSREVGRQANDASDLAHEAVRKAAAAGECMGRLAQAAARIADVVNLIEGVARQTNLLSLNATIEAARAGESGKGFAVVANEVRALSQRTAQANQDISKEIVEITQATQAAVAVMHEISQSIHRINDVAAGVADNASNQDRTLEQVAKSAGAASSGAGELRSSISPFNDGVAEVSRVAQSVGHYSKQVVAMFDHLQKRLSVTVRAFADIDRRRHVRYPVRIPVEVGANGTQRPAVILELSEGGCVIGNYDGQLPEGTTIELKALDIGRLNGRVEGHHGLGMRVRFLDVAGYDRVGLVACIAKIMKGEQRLKDYLAERRDLVERAIEHGIKDGRISMADVFDVAYQPIGGSNPPQFRSRSLAFLESILPPIQEPPLAFDPSVVFCAAVDRNAYLPVHNVKYSKPQGPDPVWNDANCRNRRIFDDRAGLSAARNFKEFLVQTYPRELGGGRVVLIKDISTPIMIQGRHWGALRMGVTV
jgi:methyl-accepting chemotaxis protein